MLHFMADRQTLVYPPLTTSDFHQARTELSSCNARFEVLLVVTEYYYHIGCDTIEFGS
jgi:hypothetical protein